MQLSSDHLNELESIAIKAAQRAGAMIQSKTHTDHEVLRKEGGSSLASQVVTEIDLESQRLILDSLIDSLSRFELGLLSEETPDDSSRHLRDHFWCIDPLDGTLAFTKGTSGYSTAISLISRSGTPLIGVVFDPVTSTLYHTVRGQGARRNNLPWTVAKTTPEAPLTLMIDNSFISKAREPSFRKKLDNLAAVTGCTSAKVIDHAGAVLNACQVIDHAPALYFKLPKPSPGGGSSWDFAATTCFFNELDLPASDIHGAPLQLNPEGDTFMNRNGVLFASHPDLAQAARRLFL